MFYKKSLFLLLITSLLISCTQIITGVPDIRKPSVAGSFYPSDKKELSRMIDDFFSKTTDEPIKNELELWGLIAPHAGYIYSGQIAAYSYKQIKDKPFKTVIILASSHYMKYQGIAIYPDGAWETPLGKILIDAKTAKYIKDKSKVLKSFILPFFQEHSIEAQLPFLQKTLTNFKIIPILFGQNISENEYDKLATALSDLVKGRPGEILIIASTDLSHYHDYTRAKIMDNIAVKTIKALDLEKLKSNLEQRNCEMCGAAGVITMMLVAEKLNTKVNIIKYANSGDTVGEKNSVVGYTSIAFYLADSHLLNISEQKTLLKIARKTLEKYVRNRVIPDYESVDDKLREKGSVFVTLKKNNELRGCIGNISNQRPLIDGVIEATIAASTKDIRFPKVSSYELDDITIEISLLSPLKKIENIEEIEVGKHGLYLCNGLKCGVLLPQVAAESKWDREEFLKMVSLKAGLPPSAWKDSNSEIYIFTAQVFSE